MNKIEQTRGAVADRAAAFGKIAKNAVADRANRLRLTTAAFSVIAAPGVHAGGVSAGEADTTSGVTNAAVRDFAGRPSTVDVDMQVDGKTVILKVDCPVLLDPTATAVDTDPTEEPTAEATKPKRLVLVEPTEEAQEDQTVEYYGVKITDAPESVDPGTVEQAKGSFVNTIGKGSEMAFAEPGGLWVGSDFDQATIDAARGAIQQFNELNHGSFTGKGPESVLAPEGGWTFFSMGAGTIEVDGVTIDLREKKGRNHFVAIRGNYPDFQQDEDLNNLVEVSDYVPGAKEWNTMQAGEDGNIAFLSEGQLLQRAQVSHTEGTNCGREGCSELILTVYDMNTGAYLILKQIQDRNEDPSDDWVSIGSNWYVQKRKRKDGGQLTDGPVLVVLPNEDWKGADKEKLAA